MKNCSLLFLLLAIAAVAQQPQTQTAPIYSVNAKYANGVAPGYAPTAGSGLTLNLGKGTANCLGVLTEYAGGTLTMTNSATNYVYLNRSGSCAPASNTSGFSSSDIWIAKVVTSGGSITSIDDVRTGFLAPGTGAGFGTVTTTGSPASPDFTCFSGSTSITNCTIPRGISFTIGDPSASSALTSGSTTTDYVTVPFGCTISAYNLAIDTGTITVKFWKIATGSAIPTSSNSISTSGVSISSGTAIHSTTTSDFTTTTVSANDIMAMTVTAVASAHFVNGVLQCDESQ
jgi:hypothetical protein